VSVSVERTKEATLVDVAERAGVSYQTVSRVINDHPNVAAATRARILKAIEELRYRPNVAARSLVMRRSQTVGIISYGTAYFGPGQMVTHIEASFRERGYGLTLSTLAELTLDGLDAAIQELCGRAVDGIVMITPILGIDPRAVRAACRNTPFVMIDITLGSSSPSVIIDQRAGGVLAARHLLELGHRRIAELRGPPDWTGAVLRHEGILAVLRESGLEPVATDEGDWTAASGHAAAHRMLDRAQPFTALVAANDQMALGAMRALRERALDVPGDVSVVGFDDLPESAYFEPPLTTVHQDFVSLGRAAAECLIEVIDDRRAPSVQRVLEPWLVVRSSTGPVP
jgi:DNA-binding LacI/PurR family transcriptional regulator